MRVLVTGAAGLIGSALVDRLLADGLQVVGVHNLSAGVVTNLEHATACNELSSRRFTLLRLDIQAPELADVVAGTNPEVIFHLAAQADLGTSVSDPLFDARSNVLGTINLCEASRRTGVRRIVYAACGGRHGTPNCMPVGDSTPVNPFSPYEAAKPAGEIYLRAYAEIHGLAPICLALTNVYGPRQNPHGAAGVITVLRSAMINGRPFTVYRDSNAYHDYRYVDDAVDAFVRAGSAPIEITGTYDIGTGQHTTVTEVHRLISAILGGSSMPSFVAARDEDLHATALDTTEAREGTRLETRRRPCGGDRADDPLALRHSRARAARPGRCVVGAQMFSHEDRTNGRSKDQHGKTTRAGCAVNRISTDTTTSNSPEGLAVQIARHKRSTL